MPSEVAFVCLFGEFYRNFGRFLFCLGIVVPCMGDIMLYEVKQPNGVPLSQFFLPIVLH